MSRVEEPDKFVEIKNNEVVSIPKSNRAVSGVEPRSRFVSLLTFPQYKAFTVVLISSLSIISNRDLSVCTYSRVW